MTNFDYTMRASADRPPAAGLIVLHVDETIEKELHCVLPFGTCDLYVTRVPSGAEVTLRTLSRMADTLTASAALLPPSLAYSVVGYGCTSGTSVIGPDRVHDLIRRGCDTRAVTEPVTALVHLCRKRGIDRLALLSPYVDIVSVALRRVLADHGIATPAFGTFNEAEEARVARIDDRSILAAAIQLAASEHVEGIFISCTNLRSIHLLDEIEALTGKPAFSSNSVLAAHMAELVGMPCRVPGAG